MQTKTVYRTKYNAHGQAESYNVPVTLYERKRVTGASTFEKIVHLVIDLVALAIIIGGILWVMSII